MLEGVSFQDGVMGGQSAHSGKSEEGAGGEGHRFGRGVKGGGRTDQCSSGAGAGCGRAAGKLGSSRSQHSLLLLLVGKWQGPVPPPGGCSEL